MIVHTCDHLKEDGVFCESPALHGRNYCYFHLNVRGRRLQKAKARRRGESRRVQLPVLEDMHSVLMGLTEVLEALEEGHLDSKKAGLMLYALQQAGTALSCTPGWQGSREQVHFEQPLRALEYPGFEEQFDLPMGVDLDLPPEAALQAAEQPADSPKVAQERRQVARIPVREASQADNFYHIPKKLGIEKGYDEETYHMARMLFDMQQAEREAEEDRADEERRLRYARPVASEKSLVGDSSSGTNDTAGGAQVA